MKSLRYLLGIVIIIMFTLGSCRKWPDSDESQTDSKLMENLVVAKNFDWKTTKTVTISLTLPVNNPSEVVRIYTENLEQLLYIGYGNATTNTVSTTITTPSYLSTAVIYYGYNNRYVPILLGFSNVLSYDYNLDLKSTNAVNCGCEGGLQTLTMKYNGSSSATIKVVENKNSVVIFENTVQPGGTFSFTGSKSTGKMDKIIYFYVNGTKKSSMQVDCKYNLYVGDNFDVFSIISGTSDNQIPLCDAPNECGCEGGLVSLTLRYTGSTTANIKVISKQGSQWVTSFSGIVDPNEEFTFTGDGNDGRLNNSLFIYVNESENTSIHTSCSVDIAIGDTYGSFKIVKGYNKNNLSLCGEIEPVDPGDDPGDDPGNNNTTTTSKGTLAYEDLWPSKGDYDFNDLVISYNFVVTKDNQDRVLNIASTFIVHAFGASFHNAFGFQLPNVNNNQIISVTGQDIASGGIFSLASNGLEQNQSKATVIVYDDSYRIMTHPGSGIGVNTVENAPYVTPDTIVVNMVFFANGSFASGGAVSYNNLNIGNFNPFIVVNKVRGREVHLPDYPPTSLANNAFFSTFNDDSDVATNRYYKSENNLPWAINIPEVFEYPYEKREIVLAYLKFAEWAESSGALYDDWYLNNSGYRNSNYIYNPN
ncbi:MAG: LruC domain-containing protein [Bacteroidetes bacterium]|nr:LruC domain-containing protein [Bacteroidota bacterium]